MATGKAKHPESRLQSGNTKKIEEEEEVGSYFFSSKVFARLPDCWRKICGWSFELP